MKKLGNLTIEEYGLAPMAIEKTMLREALSTNGKVRVNIIALGDVGTNVLMGLKLLGGDVISEIGIFDLNEKQIARLEMEFGQMHYPPAPGGAPAREMPRVFGISEAEIPNCDVVIFCATKGVPEIGASGDVRMMQLEANLGLVKSIGANLKAAAFDGFVCVVSDPVDQLCKGMLDASGLTPGQVRGFGLGVMAGRARYYSERDSRFESFLTEGRAFGPHGQDLIIANSIVNYDDAVSRELTKLVTEANLRVRDLGFKPFLAPAISSAAISIIMTLRGEWNYGSVFFGIPKDELSAEDAPPKPADAASAPKPADAASTTKSAAEDGKYIGAYLGVLSRITQSGVEYEDLELPDELFARIKEAYSNLI